jgi:hypothetical protein
MMLRSESANGHRGVQLWLAQSIPYARRGKTSYFLSADDVTVLATDPSTLIVRIEAASLKCDVVVYHSVVDARPSEEAQQ